MVSKEERERERKSSLTFWFSVAWHQDYSYWTRTTPMQHLTVHIALDDQRPENGVLQYVPGR
jgi:ectoine hydroxylase-related dioxygenase (phytanoyl-CoA dioxygenase family)